MPAIRAPKDFWAGALYAAFGGTALSLASRYPMGTGARMGAGYFPVMLGSLLLLFGLAAIVRSFLRTGEGLGEIAWRPLALVAGGVVAFAWLLPRLGLPLSLIVLILVPATASRRFRIEPRALLLMVALIAFCVALFVEGLGVPLPLLGSWLRG